MTPWVVFSFITGAWLDLKHSSISFPSQWISSHLKDGAVPAD